MTLILTRKKIKPVLHQYFYLEYINPSKRKCINVNSHLSNFMPAKHTMIYLVLIKTNNLFLSPTRSGFFVQRWIVCPLSLLQLCQVQSTFRQSYHYGQSQLGSSLNKTDTPGQSLHMFSLHSIMISCTMHIYLWYW